MGVKEDGLVRRVCDMSGERKWKDERRTSEREVGNSGSGAVWERELGLEGERRETFLSFLPTPLPHTPAHPKHWPLTISGTSYVSLCSEPLDQSCDPFSHVNIGSLLPPGQMSFLLIGNPRVGPFNHQVQSSIFTPSITLDRR